METQQKANDAERTRQFALLLTENQGALRSFVLSLIPNHPDVLDLLQEINIIIWEHKDSFKIGTNFRAWAFVVARHKVMNERKKLRRAHWLVFDDDLIDTFTEEGSECSKDWVETRCRALEKCLRKLRPQDRELVEARYTSKIEFERFALNAGRPRASLRVTLCRVRAALRRCVRQHLEPRRASE